MFCRNCGKPIFDGDEYCTFCGAKASAGTGAAGTDSTRRPEGGETGSRDAFGTGGMGTPPYNTGAYTAPVKKKGGSKAPIFIAVGAAAVLILGGIGGYALYSANDYKRPLKLVVKSLEKGDGEKLLSAIHPKMVSALIEEEGISRKELVSQYESTIGITGIVGGISVDYDITDVENWSKDDVKNLEETYASAGYDIDIDAAKTLEVEMTAKVAGMEESNEMPLTVFKADGKWYMDMDMLF